jgi:hypothetical protein
LTMPAMALPPQRGIAPPVMPTNVAIDSIQNQPDLTKSNVTPTQSRAIKTAYKGVVVGAIGG